MENYKVTKVSITKGRTLKVDMIETLDDKSQRKHPGVECDQLVHNDMIDAFAKLKFHLAKICEMKEVEGIEFEQFNISELATFAISGFNISGDSENQGVTITGSKDLLSGSKLNLNTPCTKYEGDEYQLANEMAADIQNCIYEVEQYLFHGKYAIKQLELLFEDNVTSAIEDSVNVPKSLRKGRTKKLSSNVVMELGEVASY